MILLAFQGTRLEFWGARLPVFRDEPRHEPRCSTWIWWVPFRWGLVPWFWGDHFKWGFLFKLVWQVQKAPMRISLPICCFATYMPSVATCTSKHAQARVSFKVVLALTSTILDFHVCCLPSTCFKYPFSHFPSNDLVLGHLKGWYGTFNKITPLPHTEVRGTEKHELRRDPLMSGQAALNPRVSCLSDFIYISGLTKQICDMNSF